LGEKGQVKQTTITYVGSNLLLGHTMDHMLPSDEASALTENKGWSPIQENGCQAHNTIYRIFGLYRVLIQEVDECCMIQMLYMSGAHTPISISSDTADILISLLFTCSFPLKN